jgi:hypothetical protein
MIGTVMDSDGAAGASGTDGQRAAGQSIVTGLDSRTVGRGIIHGYINVTGSRQGDRKCSAAAVFGHRLIIDGNLIDVVIGDRADSGVFDKGPQTGGDNVAQPDCKGLVGFHHRVHKDRYTDGAAGSSGADGQRTAGQGVITGLDS